MKRKIHNATDDSATINSLNLFVDAPPDKVDADDGDDSEDDSTDSEESVYSGLEEEPDTTEDEEGEETSDEADDSEDGILLFDEDTTDKTTADAVDNSLQDEQGKPASEDEDYEYEEDNLLTTKVTRKSAALRRQLKKKKAEKIKVTEFGEKDDVTKTKEVASTSEPTAADEYHYDSSDEEDIRNTVGNIPMEWYREYSHIGYDVSGKKILKPKSGDELDKFLNRMENPLYGRTVSDKLTGQNVVLSDKDVDLVQRMKSGKYVDANYNPYEPWVDTFSSDVMIHPVTNRPEHKRSFIPSKWERLKVGQFVHAMKMGWMKPRPPVKETDEEELPTYFDLWENDPQSDITKRFSQHIPAPKMSLPGHAESYNPPPEYLFTEEEELVWSEKEPAERRQDFVPRKYPSLRQVSSYTRFINERFERCLDLYLCPRQRKMRVNVDPEDLLPKLPKPSDLQPFPSTQAMVYRGHTAMVRTISVSPCGQWLVSGSDDGTVKFWEVCNARCLKTIQVGGVVKCVAWNPNVSFSLVAIAVDTAVIMLNPGLGDKLIVSNTDTMITSFVDDKTDTVSTLPVEWHLCSGEQWQDGFRLRITHPTPVGEVSWHARGNYMAVVLPRGENMSVLIHQLLKRRSQNPFKKSKGLVQCVLFHPIRPVLFVATQRYVRIYNLLKQELLKKLMTNCKWVSSMAVHRSGDNVIVGSYDCRLSWFDLDLSTKPYQVLRHHKKAVRKVAYHKSYPLFASASDDATLIVCHGMVYNDLLQNPLIVPVKVLRGHESTSDLGVLDCEFHPTQPWIFSSGADHTIRLFT